MSPGRENKNLAGAFSPDLDVIDGRKIRDNGSDERGLRNTDSYPASFPWVPSFPELKRPGSAVDVAPCELV